MTRQHVNQRGFTLIEVLVVLVIVAIITAVAVIVFGDFGRGRSEKIRVETFIRMLRVAQSQAILTPTVLGLKITPEGYSYYQWNVYKSHSKWRKLEDSVLSQPKAFGDLFLVRIKMISRYDPVEKTNMNNPAIVFLPSGYVTPFSLQLVGKAHRFLVTVSNNGTVVMKSDLKKK